MRIRDKYEVPAATLGGFLLGVLTVYLAQYAIRRLRRERENPRRIDDLMVNRRYETRVPHKLTANDDPWTHYEEVLG